MSSDAHRLGPEQLRRLRDAAADEVILGVRRGADTATLRQFVRVVDEVDRRLERSAVDHDGRLAARVRVAIAKSPSTRPAWGAAKRQ